jgi:hypothetical protein
VSSFMDDQVGGIENRIVPVREQKIDRGRRQDDGSPPRTQYVAQSGVSQVDGPPQFGIGFDRAQLIALAGNDVKRCSGGYIAAGGDDCLTAGSAS